MNPWPLVGASFHRNRSASALFIAFAVALGVAVSAQERALRKGSAKAADGFDLLVGAPGGATQLLLNAVFLQPGSVDLILGPVWAPLLDEPRAEFASPLAIGDEFEPAHGIGVTAEEDAHAGADFHVVGVLPRTGRPWDRAIIVAIETVWVRARAGLGTPA